MLERSDTTKEDTRSPTDPHDRYDVAFAISSLARGGHETPEDALLVFSSFTLPACKKMAAEELKRVAALMLGVAKVFGHE